MFRFKYLILILLFITACNDQSIENMPFFLLGRWHGEFKSVNNAKPYDIQTELLFLPFNIFTGNSKTPYEKVHFNLETYRFVAEDEVIIQGRVIDKIKITRDGQDLIIDSIHGFPDDGRYTRMSSAWDWIIEFLIIGVILLISIKKYKSRKLSIIVKYSKK